MSTFRRLAPDCAVPGCRDVSETRLGVCARHWAALPQELRDRWWSGWHHSARVEDWTRARRACIEWLAERGA